MNLYVEVPVWNVRMSSAVKAAVSTEDGTSPVYLVSITVPPVKSMPFLMPYFAMSANDTAASTTARPIKNVLYFMINIEIIISRQ
jgi:hypothetical protein